MHIEILGVDCPACDAMYAACTAWAAEQEMDIQVSKVENVLLLSVYNLSAVPGLVIDGVLISAGQSYPKNELHQLLHGRSQKPNIQTAPSGRCPNSGDPTR